MTQKPSPLRPFGVLVILTIILLMALMGCSVPESGEICSPERTNLVYEAARKRGFEAYNNLESAQQCSRVNGKPILLVFTGWAFLSDQALPWKVLEDTEIKDRVKNDFLLVTLYVDDKSKIPNPQNPNDSITWGESNLKFQVERFQTNVNPLFVLLNSELEPIGEVKGYTPIEERESFLRFLDQVSTVEEK
ncbi:hypothetical protein KFE98_19925 [bacterium SCSIO 12741]|nr:hypothetical protein KFE98_19925 [bacterium SCSIO 12741]